MTYETLYFDDYTLHFRKRAVCDASGEPVSLRPKAFAVLLYLIENRERAVSRLEILNAVWAGVVVEDQAVFQAISELRSAFRRSDYIRTIRGHGYQWVATTRSAQTRARPIKLSRFALAHLAAVFLFGTVLAVFLSNSVESGSPPQQIPIDQLLERAQQHLADDEFDAAETYLSFIVEQFPGHLMSRIELAHLYDEIGRSLEAQSLAHAVYVASNETDAILARLSSAHLLGKQQLSDGDYSSAERYGLETLRLATQANELTMSAAAHELLGETSVAAGRILAASAQFGTALELYADRCPASEERVEQRLIDLMQNPSSDRALDNAAI